MGHPLKAEPSQPSRQNRDPEATKARILDAAEEEFARYGLAGARTEAIAAKTGVTKAMIYYYFGSKEGLYQAVLQRPAGNMMDGFAQLSLEALPAPQALEQAIRFAIAHETHNPNQGKVLFHEANQNKGRFFQDTAWQGPIRLLYRIIERGIAEGSFRPCEPWAKTIQIMGVCSFYFDAYENLKYIFPDLDLRSPELIERYTQETIAMLLAGLQTQEREGV